MLVISERHPRQARSPRDARSRAAGPRAASCPPAPGAQLEPEPSCFVVFFPSFSVLFLSYIFFFTLPVQLAKSSSSRSSARHPDPPHRTAPLTACRAMCHIYIFFPLSFSIFHFPSFFLLCSTFARLFYFPVLPSIPPRRCWNIRDVRGLDPERPFTQSHRLA